MSEVQLLNVLRKDLQNFLDDLIESFPQEGDFILIRHLLSNQLSIKYVMNYIVTVLLPLRDKITNRDNTFFLDNNILFEQLDGGKVNHFKNIWKSDLSDEERECIWKWFDRFILLADKYNKHNKKNEKE